MMKWCFCVTFIKMWNVHKISSICVLKSITITNTNINLYGKNLGGSMKIQSNQETVDAIKGLLEQQKDQPSNVRIYIAGMGWGGPSFGLTLDELDAEKDLVDDSNDVNFIMAKDIYDQIGDMLVELTSGGYLVKPVDQQESDCGSCSGSC